MSRPQIRVLIWVSVCDCLLTRLRVFPALETRKAIFNIKINLVWIVASNVNCSLWGKPCFCWQGQCIADVALTNSFLTVSIDIYCEYWSNAILIIVICNFSSLAVKIGYFAKINHCIVHTLYSEPPAPGVIDGPLSNSIHFKFFKLHRARPCSCLFLMHID